MNWVDVCTFLVLFPTQFQRPGGKERLPGVHRNPAGLTQVLP